MTQYSSTVAQYTCTDYITVHIYCATVRHLPITGCSQWLFLSKNSLKLFYCPSGGCKQCTTQVHESPSNIARAQLSCMLQPCRLQYSSREHTLNKASMWIWSITASRATATRQSRTVLRWRLQISDTKSFQSKIYLKLKIPGFWPKNPGISGLAISPGIGLFQSRDTGITKKCNPGISGLKNVSGSRDPGIRDPGIPIPSLSMPCRFGVLLGGERMWSSLKSAKKSYRFVPQCHFIRKVWGSEQSSGLGQFFVPAQP